MAARGTALTPTLLAGASAAPARSPRRGPSWLGPLLTAPLMLLLLAAVAVPLAALGREAFADGGAALARVLSAGRYRDALGRSLALSAITSLGALLLAAAPAWTLARGRVPAPSLVRGALALPLTFSGVIVGFLALVMLGRVGALPHLLEILSGRPLLAGSAYTLGGLIAAYLYFEVPRAAMTLEAALRRFPFELDLAARSLGAGRWERLMRVHLPVLAPAIRATLAVTFSASLGSFGVALVLSRRFTVAPLEVYTELTGFLDRAVAGALCLVLAAMALLADRLLTGSGSAAGGAR